MQAMVKAPVASVAAYRPTHVRGSMASASPAIARRMMNATQTASASCATLNVSLMSGSRRRA